MRYIGLMLLSRTELQFEESIEDLKERKEFQDYNSVLRNLNVEDYIQKFKDNKEYKSYWAIQASCDLCPNIENKYVVDKFDVGIGEMHSIKDIVKRIVGNTIPDKMVFTSKYLNHLMQIRKFELFAEAFKQLGVKEIWLVTKEKVKLCDESIRIKQYNEVYGEKQFTPHDRYFAFKVGNLWHYYKMTAELDQFKLEETNIPINEWRTESIGRWKDISFMHIQKEVCPNKLLTYIESL